MFCPRRKWRLSREITETSVDDVGTNRGGVNYYWNSPGCDRTLLAVHTSHGSLAAKDAVEAIEDAHVAVNRLRIDDRPADYDQFGADSFDQPGAIGKYRRGRKAHHFDGMGSSRLLGYCEQD